MRAACLLVALAACTGAPRPESPEPSPVTAYWPHGLGRYAPGTDTTTVCAVRVVGGRVERATTAVLVRRYRTGDLLAEWAVIPGEACSATDRWPSFEVRWSISHSSAAGKLVPTPVLLSVRPGPRT